MSTGTPLLFGSAITLGSAAFEGLSLSGRAEHAMTGCPVSFERQRSCCEQWYILNPDNLADRSPVFYGATVVFSCCARATCCLSFDPDKDIGLVLMTAGMGVNERWRLVNPTDQASRAVVNRFARVGLRWEKRNFFYLSCFQASGGAAPTARTMTHCSAWETFHLTPGGGTMLSRSVKPVRSGSSPQLQDTTGAGTEIAGPSAMSAVVGERMSFGILPSPDIRIERTTWTIDPAGNPVAGYGNGAIQPLAPLLIGDDVLFFWTRPGTFTMTVQEVGTYRISETTTWAPGTSTKRVTFTVLAPLVLRGGTKAGGIRLEARGPYPFPRPSGGPEQLPCMRVIFDGVQVPAIMNLRSQNTGILLSARVAPEGTAGGGELCWVQTVNSRRNATHSDGAVVPHNSNGVFVLDNVNPYNQYPIPFDAMSARLFFECDGPEQSFTTVDATTPGGPRRTMELDIRDEFRMYLMWRCDKPGAIWATLGKFEWFWQALLTAPDGGHDYSLVELETDFTNKAITPTLATHENDNLAIRSAELPVWTATLDSSGFRNPLDVTDPVTHKPVPPYWQTDTAVRIPPMGEEELVIFQFDASTPRFVPLAVPVPQRPTRQDGEAALGRKFGPDISYQGKTWCTTWASGVIARRVAYFNSVWTLPRDFRMANIDLSPLRGAARECWLSVQIAPLCWADQDYWSAFAREPITACGITEENRTRAGFIAKVRALAPGARVLRRAEDEGSIWVIFTGSAPSRQLVEKIADISQTFHIRRWGENEFRMPPLPDDDPISQ